MKTRRFSALVAGTAALVVFSVSALADGMPYGNSKAQAPLTPLDQALDQIQAQEPPVSIVEETTTTTEIAPAVAPLPAPEARVVEVQDENPSFLGLSIGMYDPLTHGEQAAAFNFEWQPGVQIAGFLQPLFGAFATTEGAMMGYGGVGVPFNITDHVFLMPSVSIGAYKEGAGYDLGRTFAVRYGTELAYQFDDKSRLGLNAHVISNARSFDREDRTEIFSLVYTMPTTFLSGRSERIAQPQAVMPAATAPAPEMTTTTTTTTTGTTGPLVMPTMVNP